jgi:Tfp pilus assembly protein PilF
MSADDGNGATAFFLGWAYHAAGDDRQAISSWRRAAFLEPTLVPAHLALAELYVQLSQPALARQALRAGLEALPDSPELKERLARLDTRR